MARKILAWVLLVLGGLFLLLSLAGILLIWVYNTPVTNEAIRQLQDMDADLAQVEITLQNSEDELARALRIVDATQAAFDQFTKQSNSQENFLDTIQSTLDDKLLPELTTTRDRIVSARLTLEQLQAFLEGVQSFIPGLDLSAPDKVLKDLIVSANSLDAEISNVEALGKQASLFVSDTSYLLGGDLTETRGSLQNFIIAIQDYQTKVATWRGQISDLLEGTPKWIDQASISLTIFLFWFGLSQVGLILHGLSMRQGGDPLRVLRRTKVDVNTDGIAGKEQHKGEE